MGRLKLSIRGTLGLIMGVTGLLLLGVTATMMVGAMKIDRDAHRIETLAQTSRNLFSALIPARNERGNESVGLNGEAPATAATEQAVATYRADSEKNYAEALERLAALDQPSLAPVVANLKSAHDVYAELRPRADAAIRQKKTARDPVLVQAYGKI